MFILAGAFEANSALSRENETKIVKITHSVSDMPTFAMDITEAQAAELLILCDIHGKSTITFSHTY